MPRTSPRLLFDACYGSYAIAAVNVFSMEQVLGLFLGAHQARSAFYRSDDTLCEGLCFAGYA